MNQKRNKSKFKNKLGKKKIKNSSSFKQVLKKAIKLNKFKNTKLSKFLSQKQTKPQKQCNKINLRKSLGLKQKKIFQTEIFKQRGSIAHPRYPKHYKTSSGGKFVSDLISTKLKTSIENQVKMLPERDSQPSKINHQIKRQDLNLNFFPLKKQGNKRRTLL